MEQQITPERALELALTSVPSPRPDGDPATLAAEVASTLGTLGFTVAKAPHGNRWGPPEASDTHDCYHCDRPENTDPFVVPGTPLELLTSEGDAGRFRHWGASDLWVCRTHPGFMDGDDVEAGGPRRMMEVYEALEHLAARDSLPDAVRLTHAGLGALEASYLDEHRDRLAALDRHAPHGGHQGRQP